MKTLSFLVSLIYIINCQEIPAIPSLNSLRSYHTKVTFTENEKKYKYEEFYESVSKRGRLSIVSDDDVKDVFYTSNPPQKTTIKSWDTFSNCTVEIFNDEDDFGMFYDMVDVDKKNGTVTIGPMAVWRKIYRIRGATAGPNVFKHRYDTIRGVETSIYSVSIKNEEDDRHIEASLAFMKVNWSRFEDVTAQVPVQFIVKGSEKGRPINHQFDFYLIEEETVDSVVSDIQPTPGIGCPGFQSPKDASFPGSKKTFPDQVAFSLEVYDLINNSNETMIKRHDMAYDGEELIARFDNYIPDQEEADVYIQDLRRGIVFRKQNGGKCEIGHVEDTVDDRFIGYTHGMRTIQTLRQVLKTDGDYYNLGKAQRRGITLDVWETIIDVSGEEVDVMLGTSGASVKRVITHFFSNETIMEDMFRQVLIMSLVTDYTDDGLERQVKSQKEMSYFDFRELNFGDTYLDTFNVADCITDPASRRYFDIFVKHIDDSGSGASQIDLTKHSAQIRQLTQKMVANSGRISTIRVPQINIIHERNDGIMLNALILEKEPSIVSFRKKKSVDGLAMPTSRDDEFKVEQENECADLALANSTSYKSFLFCSGTCYLRSYGPDDPQGGGVPRNVSEPCELWERSLLGTDGIELVAEPDLDEVERILFQNYADGELKITIKDPDREEVQNLMVSSIMVSRTEEDDEDMRQDPYRETSPGFKIKTADTSKTIEPKDSTTPLTVGDCFLSCKEDDSMSCQTFSFCDAGKIECIISSLMIDESSSYDPQAPMALSANCSTYSMSYMHRFDKFNGFVNEISGEIVEKKSKDAASCARECSLIDDFNCESFAFCGSECILRREHMFETVTVAPPTNGESNKQGKNVTGKGCILYHLKSLMDYTVTGIDLVSGDDVITRHDGIDANSCANLCNKETDCRSINFCTLRGMTSCELTSNSPYEVSATTVRNESCLNYVQISKSSVSHNWGDEKIDNEKQSSPGSMSGGAFFGVLCAMVILGSILGVVGIVGFNWYKNRGTGLGGLGVSVKYVRQNNDTLINNEEPPATSFSTAVPLD